MPDWLTVQRPQDVEPDLLRIADPGPGALPGTVRRQRHPVARLVVQIQQRIVVRQGFFVEHVEGDATDITVSDGTSKGGLVDEFAAGGVDEKGSRFHQTDLAGADDTVSFVVESELDGQDVGGGKELVPLDVADAV